MMQYQVDLEKSLAAIAANGQGILAELSTSTPARRPTSRHPLSRPDLNTPDESVQLSRRNLMEAANKILQDTTLPSEYMDHLAGHYHNIACLKWLVDLAVLKHVPVPGSVKYEKLAILAKVPLAQLKSVCRMAITHNFLAEPLPGEVGHNVNSILLVENPDAMNSALFMTNYSVPTALKFADATKLWGQTSAKNETAYQLAAGIDLPFFDHLRVNSDLNAMFSSYMKNVASTEAMNIEHLVHGFDWAALPNGASVVDVGGSRGHVSLVLAEAFPHLNFLVQDLPETVEEATTSLSFNNAIGKSRVRFMAHDLFTPQPIVDADIYLYRMIIHDWPDEQAAKILSQAAAALKPSAQIVIMDTLLPLPGTVPKLHERQLRVRDLTMQQVFNAKERGVEDWTVLIESIGLELRNVEQPLGSAAALLTVGLRRMANDVVLHHQLDVNGSSTSNRDDDHGFPAESSPSKETNYNSETVPESGLSREIHSNSTAHNAVQVLIIGAGVGGLCLAQGLHRVGIPFKVFERDPSEMYRPQGYRLKLESDAAEALRQCLPPATFEAFETSCAISTIGETDFNPINGYILKSRAGGGLAGAQGLRATYTVDRATFRSILTRGIEEHVVYGEELLSYCVDGVKKTVTARFKKGTSAQGAILVGADGIRSAVRKQLLPNQHYVDTGAVCIYGKTLMNKQLFQRFPGKGLRWMTVSVDQAPLLQSILIQQSPLTLLSEPIRFSDASREQMILPADYVYWVLIGRKELFEDQSGDTIDAHSPHNHAESSVRQSLELTAEWHPDIRSLIELQDPSQSSTMQVVSQKPDIESWQPSAYVTLLGDAVHAMSPCGGVGANTALRDSAELTKIIAAAGGRITADHIGEYEDGLRERAFKSIMRSFAGSEKMFNQKPFSQCKVVHI